MCVFVFMYMFVCANLYMPAFLYMQIYANTSVCVWREVVSTCVFISITLSVMYLWMSALRESVLSCLCALHLPICTFVQKEMQMHFKSQCFSVRDEILMRI